MRDLKADVRLVCGDHDLVNIHIFTGSQFCHQIIAGLSSLVEALEHAVKCLTNLFQGILLR